MHNQKYVTYRPIEDYNFIASLKQLFFRRLIKNFHRIMHIFKKKKYVEYLLIFNKIRKRESAKAKFNENAKSN